MPCNRDALHAVLVLGSADCVERKDEELKNLVNLLSVSHGIDPDELDNIEMNFQGEGDLDADYRLTEQGRLTLDCAVSVVLDWIKEVESVH